MPEENLTRDLGTALSIDYVEQFGKRLNSLFTLLGLHRVLPVPTGTVIKTYTSSVTLDETEIEPGEIIPLSEVKMEDGPTYEIAWDKKRKAVPAEDIQKYGFERAILRTDEKLLNSIQKGIRDGLLANLATGTGTQEGENFKQLLAKNTASVKVAFEEDDPEVISFVNTFDAYDYLGDSDITTQTLFGMTYIENFMDNKIVFLSGDVPAGTIYSTAVDNLVIYYVDVASGEISKAFDFVTQEEGLIGVTHDINKQRLTAETITLYGLVWLAERLDGVIVGEIVEEDDEEEENGDVTPLLVVLAEGSEGVAGDSKITGLDSEKAYTIKFGGETFPVLAGGIVSEDPQDTPQVLGVGITEIIGLENGVEYLVLEVEVEGA